MVGGCVSTLNSQYLLSRCNKQRLTRFIDAPEVVVILTESRSKSYYILGQIREPGEYPIARPVTVLQAIARAGGFDEWAKKDRIMIVTEPGEQGTIEIFNYDNFLRNADSKKNMVIKPGDTIVVP
jgi:polysaccharide biosynthesis/export protein